MAATQSLLLGPRGSSELPKTGKRRAFSMDLPERFKNDEEEDASEEDAAKPDEAHPEALIQQSMYGVIAAAHIKGAVQANFQQDSGSDTDLEAESSKRNSRDLSQIDRTDSGATSAQREQQTRQGNTGSRRHQKSGTTEDRASQALHNTPPGRRKSPQQDLMTHSQILPSKNTVPTKLDRPASHTRRNAPLLDLKVQAHARADMASPSSSTLLKDRDQVSERRVKAPVALPQALAEIFQFEEPEEVIPETGEAPEDDD